MDYKPVPKRKLTRLIKMQLIIVKNGDVTPEYTQVVQTDDIVIEHYSSKDCGEIRGRKLYE